MPSLIAMCTYDLEGSGRTDMTRQTLESLERRVDFSKHEFYVHDNGSCQETLDMLEEWKDLIPFTLLKSETNIGTAKGINACWKFRKPDQFCIKIDNDIVVNQDGWVDLMEEAILREPKIGLIGLKRRDLTESSLRTDWGRTRLIELPHERHQRWIYVEQVDFLFGSCIMASPQLMDKIGGLVQPTQYGFDDAIHSKRAHYAGYLTCFLVGVDILHVDFGNSEYTDWKVKHSGEAMAEYNEMLRKYKSGELPLYHPIE